MKNVRTLVDDIYALLSRGAVFDKEHVREFGTALADKLSNRLSEERGPPTLRISNLGKPCKRQLWYSIKTPKLAEDLPPATRLKFLFGDVIEELMLFLAKAAGHTVEREQEEIEINGVKGHIDAVIDGELVDVKSASTFSFNKFKDHKLAEDDAFGYLTQIGSYGSKVGEGQNHFLAIDKTLGHVTLDSWDKSDEDYEEKVEDARAMLQSDIPPPRGYDDVPDGASGNRRLGVACSYCAFRGSCWPGLRTYAYANGPKFLTVVAREPKVNQV